MNLGFPVQELPARNALTVAVSCVNRTRKRVADAARFSVRPAVSYIERSTRSLHTGNVESEKELRAGNKTSAHFVLKSSFNGVTSLD